MEDTMKIDKHLVHLLSYFKIMRLLIDQYTMLGSSDQNGVADRRNKTLLDMVHSMLSSSKLPKLLWTEALKTTAYVLNQVPTKAITNTPFEQFKGWKPSLQHMRV